MRFRNALLTSIVIALYPHRTLALWTMCEQTCANNVGLQTGCYGVPCGCEADKVTKVAQCFGSECPGSDVSSAYETYSTYCQYLFTTIQLSEDDFTAAVQGAEAGGSGSIDPSISSTTTTPPLLYSPTLTSSIIPSGASSTSPGAASTSAAAPSTPSATSGSQDSSSDKGGGFNTSNIVALVVSIVGVLITAIGYFTRRMWTPKVENVGMWIHPRRRVPDHAQYMGMTQGP